MTYNIKEFRDNLRKAFNEAEYGEDVFIKRHDTTYFLCTEEFFRELIKEPTKPFKDISGVVKPSIKRCKHGNPLGECLDKKADRSCKG